MRLLTFSHTHVSLTQPHSLEYTAILWSGSVPTLPSAVFILTWHRLHTTRWCHILQELVYMECHRCLIMCWICHFKLVPGWPFEAKAYLRLKLLATGTNQILIFVVLSFVFVCFCLCSEQWSSKLCDWNTRRFPLLHENYLYHKMTLWEESGLNYLWSTYDDELF